MTVYRIGSTFIEADDANKAAEYANLLGLLGDMEVEYHPTAHEQAEAKIKTAQAQAVIVQQINERPRVY